MKNRESFYKKKYPELVKWMLKYYEEVPTTTLFLSQTFGASGTTISTIANTLKLKKANGPRSSNPEFIQFNIKQKKILFNHFVNGDADIADLLKFPEFGNNNFNQISTFIKSTTNAELKKEIGYVD